MAGADGCECSNYFYETSRPGGGGAPSKGNVEKLGGFTATATKTLRQMPEELRHRLGPGWGRGRVGITSGKVPSLDKVQNLSKTKFGESRSSNISS